MSSPFSRIGIRVFLCSAVLAVTASSVADCLVPYTTPLTPIARKAQLLVTADFDGNGKPDLAGSSDLGVFVVLNNGTDLGAPADVRAGDATGGLVAADVNNDSHVDLVFASGTSLFRLPGNGNGTFAAAVEMPIGVTATSIAIARIDNDPYPDLLAFDPAQAKLVLFSNNGSGVFTEASHVTLNANARVLLAADLDADGWTDAVVGYAATGGYHAFYGHGDGTLESAVTLYGASNPVRLRAADVTGDGLLDLLALTDYGYVATIRNLGSRSFSDPLLYSTGSYLDLGIADLTGDGEIDPLATSHCGFRSWRSTGIGTLDDIWRNEDSYCYPSIYGTATVANADFDGDGRVDVVLGVGATLANPTASLRRYRNLCGDGILSLTTETPVISVGQTAKLRVFMRPPAPLNVWYAALGSFSIVENATTWGSGTLGYADATVTVSNLPVGQHSLVAKYAGDEQYEPVDSEPLPVRVTNETTTTTITADPPKGVYGALSQFTATITSSDGTTPTGPIQFKVDGTRVYPDGTAPQAQAFGATSVGDHTYQADFMGDAAHPPSTATITYTIAKQTPAVAMTPQSTTAGMQTGVWFTVQSHFPVYWSDIDPTGVVTIKEGTNVLASGTLTYDGYFGVNLPPFAAGRHELFVTYDGDANYNATTVILPFLVVSESDSAIDARGTLGAVAVNWYSPGKPIVSRRRYDEPWGTGGMCCSNPPWIDGYPAQETVYLYRMESYDRQSWTAADVAVRIAFTNDPLLPGVAIKAIHLQEIVRATNILRSAANLPALALDTAPGTPVMASSIMTIRNAINEARVALGAYPFMFTGAVSPGNVIAASHIRELREAVR